MAERPTHGQRRRCTCTGTDRCKKHNDAKPCRQFARRGTVPATCHGCGAGTRAEAKHEVDDAGRQRTTKRGLVTVPARVQQLIDGTLDVADLDEEELARGYPRAEDGSFRGRPSVIPTVVHQRIQRELFARAGEKLKANLLAAAQTMASIAADPEQDPKVRMDAAKWVIERLMGKTPDVAVTMDEKRYEKLLDRMDRGAIPLDEEEHDGREA